MSFLQSLWHRTVLVFVVAVMLLGTSARADVVYDSAMVVSLESVSSGLKVSEAAALILRPTISQPRDSLAWTVLILGVSQGYARVSGSITVEVPELRHTEKVTFTDLLITGQLQLGGPFLDANGDPSCPVSDGYLFIRRFQRTTARVVITSVTPVKTEIVKTIPVRSMQVREGDVIPDSTTKVSFPSSKKPSTSWYQLSLFDFATETTFGLPMVKSGARTAIFPGIWQMTTAQPIIGTIGVECSPPAGVDVILRAEVDKFNNPKLPSTVLAP